MSVVYAQRGSSAYEASAIVPVRSLAVPSVQFSGAIGTRYK